MVRPLLVLSLVSLALVGCKGSREKDVVGSWSASGATMTALEDKTFTSTSGSFSLEGSWSVEKDTVTFTAKTINGKPISDIKATLQQKAGSLPAGAKSFVDDLDKPNVFQISGDGKTMATDKTKDTNSGPPTTFTKSSS